MAKKSDKILSVDYDKKKGSPFIEIIGKEKSFLVLILIGIILSLLFYSNPFTAMWLGFFFAAYAAIANDSIQTIGTFIGSNMHRSWWKLWLFVGLIFIITVTISWVIFDGDVTYQRLVNSEGKTKYPHPEEFSFVQVIAPLILLIITRLRMPVSTTFLLLSSFSTDTSGITDILSKSLSGYFLAFVFSFLIWAGLYNYISKNFKKRKSHVAWDVVQWTISGILWSVWLMQDAANISVFLPRRLDLTQLLVFITFIFLGLGLLMYLRGDRIQKIVSEKKRISDVRAATLIDFSYALLLIYKLFISTVPMSTTWVFLGVIGGREIAISLMRKKKKNTHKKKALFLVGKDMLYALIGLLISIILAIAVNPKIREDLGNYLGL
jgi:hypothetical protein